MRKERWPSPVEGTSLLTSYVRNGIGGSNPPLSVFYQKKSLFFTFHFPKILVIVLLKLTGYMSKNNYPYKSYPRVVKEKFPFWVIPTSLLLFVIAFFIWNVMSINHPLEKNTINFIEKQVNSHDVAYMNSNSVLERYKLGLGAFSRKDYQQAGIIFENLYKEKNLSQNMKLRVCLYYAYSMFLNARIYDDRNLLQDSKDFFQNLLQQVNTQDDALYIRILLGYAKAARYLDQYPGDLDVLLKQMIFKAQEKAKRQIFLELGYYYASNQNYDTALIYFLRAQLPVTTLLFYKNICESSNTSHIILGLLKNKLVPVDLLSQGLAESLKDKLFKNAINQFNDRNIAESKRILLGITNLFSPQDPAYEDAYYLLGYYSQFDNNNREAIDYYKRVLGNPQKRRYSAALYQIALMNLNAGHESQAKNCFVHIIQVEPKSVFARESSKWVEDIQSGVVDKANNDNGKNLYNNSILPSITYNTNYFSIKAKKHPKRPPAPKMPMMPTINLNVENGISGSNNQTSTRTTPPVVIDHKQENRDQLQSIQNREQALRDEMQKLKIQKEMGEKLEKMKDKASVNLNSKLEEQKQHLENMIKELKDEMAKNTDTKELKAKIEKQEMDIQHLKNQLDQNNKDSVKQKEDYVQLQSKMMQDQEELKQLKNQPKPEVKSTPKSEPVTETKQKPPKAKPKATEDAPDYIQNDFNNDQEDVLDDNVTDKYS